MHIQCTKKMLDFLKPEIIVKNTDDDFFAWHADYFNVFRKKLFCLMNDLTRYCVVLYGLKKSDFKNPTELFARAVFITMAVQGYDLPLATAYTNQIHDVTFGKTKDRKLVARLNRAMFDLSWCCDGEFLAEYPEQPQLALRLNESPVGQDNWKISFFPFQKMLEYLKMLQ
ncbi:MAG TPA: hypothetical protein DCR44_03850 [Acholeplasmatales bacterium]|nr:hypothetical protein [Bacillota bacterium]OHE40584.1 MAG: hypothetical protein A2Y16_01495 [Tenericutes bacterium GWF2_57_13]HAQ56517.1 hypothetical protein [Acholeplasmatales bacterium]